ncbi:MAG: dTDP-4-dehydrorhamnose 3 5-epimerase [Ignavibacteria bacterium]|nr:MAG: dTDP-4-dehydrorhamnose 3 5-epimerase [Ignavibacteria bacterium]KAF0160705.1 MAG: dTDP-4-dehydrorhamnose 3 5-epimerase [Ignavibacteria bacterium]
MNFEKVYIDGLLVVSPEVFPDERGYFFESFNKEKYKTGGIDFSFVQDNLSKSKKGTVRGLHYQVGDFEQGKLCSVIVGKVLDIAVDIRFGSPTFGMYYSSELSEENKKQLWIPPGFAHGFSVLSQEAIFSYKCTNVYSKLNERSIIFNDEILKIDWQVETHIVSSKDLLAKKFSEIEQDFTYKPE